MSIQARGILYSYLLGAPVGLIVVVITLVLPGMLTGEGLGLLMLLGGFGAGIVGLVTSFLIVLWPAGKKVGADLDQGRSLLRASFRYSLRVNSIIWTSFALFSIIQQSLLLSSTGAAAEETGWMTLAIISFAGAGLAFGGCTFVSTFTIGLLICRLTKG